MFNQCLSCDDKNSFSYTIAGGDTLASISNGDEKLIEEIKRLNPSVFENHDIDDDMTLLPEGKLICKPFDADSEGVFYMAFTYPYRFSETSTSVL